MPIVTSSIEKVSGVPIGPASTQSLSRPPNAS
jgi:hypothetical protein